MNLFTDDPGVQQASRKASTSHPKCSRGSRGMFDSILSRRHESLKLTRCNRVTLDKWEAQQVQFHLSYYDMAVWDVVASRWTVPAGDFKVYVGRSAFDDDSLQRVIPASWLPGPDVDIYAD
jgi:hypothetical protein